jgi:hypothetical protein
MTLQRRQSESTIGAKACTIRIRPPRKSKDVMMGDQDQNSHPTDDAAPNEKDDQRAIQEIPSQAETSHFERLEWGNNPFLVKAPYGLHPDSAPAYRVVPRELAEVRERHSLEMWMWRVEFHGLGRGEPALGLDILGPIIFGRATAAADPTVDVDFTPYGAIDKGVSRQHAMIRPTQQRLYLIDLSSTNGTKHNELPVGPGMAIVLQDHDMVTLGRLTFEIRILNRPAPPASEPGAAPPKDTDTRPLS